MNNEIKETIVRQKHGYSLVELLVAMAITVLTLGAVFGIFKSIMDSSAAASQVYELVANDQAVLNLIRRDLQKTVNIPLSGIPLPNTPVNIPGKEYCDELDAEFLCNSDEIIPLVGRYAGGGISVLDAVTPITVNGKPAIIILYADAPGLSGENWLVLGRPGAIPGVLGGADNATLTLNTDDNDIREGDFILIRNTAGNSVMRRVSGRSCNAGICSDRIDLHQDGEQYGLSGDVGITLLRRTTYYLAGDPAWIMRQVNGRSAERLVQGVGKFDLSYDLIDSSEEGTGFSSKPVVTAFFQDYPDRMKDIRVVNVDITIDAESVVPAGGDMTKSIQKAEIAVRRGVETNVDDAPVYCPPIDDCPEGFVPDPDICGCVEDKPIIVDTQSVLGCNFHGNGALYCATWCPNADGFETCTVYYNTIGSYMPPPWLSTDTNNLSYNNSSNCTQKSPDLPFCMMVKNMPNLFWMYVVMPGSPMKETKIMEINRSRKTIKVLAREEFSLPE